jgi:beta-glucanase (GH16 family)
VARRSAGPATSGPSASRHPRPSRRLVPLGVIATMALGAAAGLAATDTTQAAVPRNLVVDPELAQGTGAWTSAAGGGLSVVAGHAGHRAVRVTNTSGHAVTLALNDRANTVASTRAAADYTASAWVRSAVAGVSVAAREGEWAGARSKGVEQSSAWLADTQWHFVTVTYHAVADGSSLDFNVVGWQVPAGRSIDVSQPSLTSTTAAPVTAPPAATPPTPAPPSVPTAPKAPAGYKLAFSDEFNGSAVNTGTWRVHNNTWASNEESMDTSRARNLFEANGALTLRARRENYTAHGTSRHYTSASMDTIGKHSWKYGRFEVRAKLPTTVGSWPAFWLRADHGLGEVDVMEAVGGKPSYVVQTLHQSTNGGRARLTHGVSSFKGGSPTSSWHTYAVTVTRSLITWDVDGDTVFSVRASNAPWITSTFDDTLNIRLNLQVGGSMPAYFKLPVTAASTFPADYSIDYVRVYQKL